MAESIPFKYGNKNSNANVSQFSIKNTDTDGKENKEDYLIFENGTQNEVLIQIQTIERIFKGAQTAQRRLVELTRNQFTIRSEAKEKKEHRTRNPKAKERKEHRTRNPKAEERKKLRTGNPKAKERERILRERESKSYTGIPASERYKNNLSKKAEKLAKEEKETKKKISIKNGEKSVHFMTPMVKIREEYQDLEYESNDEED
jgi:hypothetical protein